MTAEDFCGLRIPSNDWSNVVNVTERARLLAVAENRHRPALHDLVHENADDVAVAVAEFLIFTVNIVRSENDIIQPEHFMRLL